MRLALAIILLLIITGSAYADWRWKRWVARQQETRRNHPDEYR